MLDVLKKMAYIGLGLASLTKDKIEEVSEKIAAEAKLSEEEGKKLYDELLQRSKEAKENLQKQIDETVQKTLQRLNVPTADDLHKIDERLTKIEEKID